MKGQRARLLLRALGLLVLVSLILAMVGCSSGGGGGGDKDAIALMKKLPQGTDSFMFADFKALRTDDDLEDMYEGISDDMGGMTSDMEGMSIDDLDFLAMAGEMVFIVQGDFDLEAVRESLEDAGYEKDDYQDVEVWKTFGMATAMTDDDCIISASDTDVEDCIDAIKGKAKSLYEESGVKDDMGKLPGDSLVVAWSGGGDSFFASGTYTGMEATAVSISKKNADDLTFTGAMRFKDSASAKDAMDDIETDLEENSEAKISNLKVTQDGEYVKVTGEMDMDEFMLS